MLVFDAANAIRKNFTKTEKYKLGVLTRTPRKTASRHSYVMPPLILSQKFMIERS